MLPRSWGLGCGFPSPAHSCGLPPHGDSEHLRSGAWLEKGSANGICGTDEEGWKKESSAELQEPLSVAAPREVVSWDGELSGQNEMRGPSMPSWIHRERGMVLE